MVLDRESRGDLGKKGTRLHRFPSDKDRGLRTLLSGISDSQILLYLC